MDSSIRIAEKMKGIGTYIMHIMSTETTGRVRQNIRATINYMDFIEEVYFGVWNNGQ